MSQYADGGATTTKPYISSSNYILKMSNYTADSNWDRIWDALYWNFINNNKDKIKNIGRIAFQVAFWNKKPDDEKKELLKIAKEFINKMTKG
jgi:deoxyribodipyrimidine photolyase-related protein